MSTINGMLKEFKHVFFNWFNRFCKALLALSRFKKIAMLSLVLFAIVFYFSLPTPLFKTSYSTVIEDVKGNILTAAIASDGQWRFPAATAVPAKFKTCLLQFEDEYFYQHPGVNPVAIVRALWQNTTKRKRISGGSTLTMQTIRIAGKGRRRNVWHKCIEILLALRLEMRYSKEEILQLYVAHAPFGGNVVGLEAASWRYFGRSPDKLSWAEAAMLAVLPNSPALIYPGKNQVKLFAKRNRLLLKLKNKGIIDGLTYRLAILERVPEAPFPLPNMAPHLFLRAVKDGLQGNRIRTSLAISLQHRATEVLNRYHLMLKANGVFNGCAIIIDVKTGKVLAYIGNTNVKEKEHGGEVDIIASQRSYGSLMKPFLYAFALDEGKIAPHSLLPDYPIVFDGYAPQNFSGSFEGVVPAGNALTQSLNIPFVKLLQEYGIEIYHYKLHGIGCQSITKPAGHYGLSIILGGAESTLWEMTGIYAGMARTLNNFKLYHGKYRHADFLAPTYLAHPLKQDTVYSQVPLMSAGALWHTFKAMADVNRSDLESNWKSFATSNKISWKTGTSFGFRDAWSIGVTPEYAIGVWLGNADGEGRAGLQGITTASPIMFELFGLVHPSSSWFLEPEWDLRDALICKQSGYRASEFCDEKETVRIPKGSLKAATCKYHKAIHFDKTGTLRVNSNCESVFEMQIKNHFVLPPIMEWYFKKHHTNYQVLPAFKTGCDAQAGQQNMQFIYPRSLTKIFVPREIDGEMGKTVFELAHRKSATKVFWHLDGVYLGYTKNIHQMPLAPLEGKHHLSVVDENGESLDIGFEMVN